MKYLEKLKNEKLQRCATMIKAFWRGYKARLAMKKLVIAKQLAEVQRRVSEAHKNVTEDKKLCNRTAYALDYLFTFKDMGQLIIALEELNVTLRYSTNCCARMLEEDGKAVRILTDLLNGLNRSVPHIDVMSIIFDILLSLAEFQETRSKLATIEVVYKSVLMAMSKGEKNAEVLGKGCSLFWRLAHEVEGRNHLKNDFIFKKLNEFEGKQKRLKRQSSLTMVQKRENFNKTTSSATNLRKNIKTLTTKHGCP